MGWFTGDPKSSNTEGKEEPRISSTTISTSSFITCHDDPEDATSMICVEELSEQSNQNGRDSSTVNKREFRMTKNNYRSGLFDSLFSQFVVPMVTEEKKGRDLTPSETQAIRNPLQQLFNGFVSDDFLRQVGMLGIPKPQQPQMFQQPPTNQQSTGQTTYQPNYFHRSSKPDEKIYDM